MIYTKIDMQSMEVTATLEECEEIKRFYKPYLEKYESKYRILYQILLQQPSVISTQESTSGMTPSLATLDDAPSLRQREWNQGDPGEEISSTVYKYWWTFDANYT